MSCTIILDNPEYSAGHCILDNDILTSSSRTRPYRKGWPAWSRVHKDDEEITQCIITIDETEVLI